MAGDWPDQSTPTAASDVFAINTVVCLMVLMNNLHLGFPVDFGAESNSNRIKIKTYGFTASGFNRTKQLMLQTIDFNQIQVVCSTNYTSWMWIYSV